MNAKVVCNICSCSTTRKWQNFPPWHSQWYELLLYHHFVKCSIKKICLSNVFIQKYCSSLGRQSICLQRMFKLTEVILRTKVDYGLNQHLTLNVSFKLLTNRFTLLLMLYINIYKQFIDVFFQLIHDFWSCPTNKINKNAIKIPKVHPKTKLWFLHTYSRTHFIAGYTVIQKKQIVNTTIKQQFSPINP